MNILNKYKQLLNEEITKYQFVEAARKDPMLKQWINNFMSFDNIVDVLKNKRIITEAINPNDDPYNDKFNPDNANDSFPEQGNPDLSIPDMGTGNDLPEPEEDEVGKHGIDKDEHEGIAVGDEVKYIGEDETLKSSNNLVVSRIYGEGDDVYLDVENIENGEPSLKVPFSEFSKEEFNISELGLFGIGKKKQQVPTPAPKEDGVEYRPKADRKLQQHQVKKGVPPKYPSVGKIKYKPAQNEGVGFNKPSVDDMRRIAGELKAKGLDDVQIVDTLIKMRQGGDENAPTSEQPVPSHSQPSNSPEQTKELSPEEQTVADLTKALKRQGKNDNEAAEIISKLKQGDKATLNSILPKSKNISNPTNLRRDVIGNLYTPNIKEDKNHIDWETISEEDAYKLFDYHERTGRLPYGLAPEKYNTIVAKYNVSGQSNDDDTSDESNTFGDLQERKNPIKGGKGDKLGIDDVSPDELRMGIKVEMEHTDDRDKAIDIALDHLSENPIYYTRLKLSGLADELKCEPKKKKRTDLPVEVDKSMSNTVDKDNAMKTVKGYSKEKASSKNSNRETVKPAKNVQQLTHKAKKAPGIKQVMDMTGGNMKKVKIKESLKDIIKRMILEEAKAWGGWKVIKEKKSKLKSVSGGYDIENSPEALNEDHLNTPEEQIKYILQHKDVIKQKDQITPEYLQSLNTNHIRKIYQAVELKVKDNQQLGGQEPEFHDLQEDKKSCSCGCNSCGDKKN